MQWDWWHFGNAPTRSDPQSGWVIASGVVAAMACVAAVAQIQPLAQELPYALGVAIK